MATARVTTAPPAVLCRPNSLEIASGLVLGLQGAARERPGGEKARAVSTSETVDPLTALEAAVLPALLRNPCVLSFSGGMDSSFLLAVATRVARREGLPDPVPVTWRFTEAPLAEESGWQQDVYQALELSNWVTLQAGDDLDLIGPVARQIFELHGVIHPANLHLHLPIIAGAAGGSIITGFGGDQILSGFRTRPRTIRSRLPDRARMQLRMHRGKDPLPWLHRRVSVELQRRHLAELRSQPTTLGGRIDWQMRRRDLTLTRAQFRMVADEHRVLAVHPFLDSGFHDSIRNWQASAGLAGRAQLLDRIGRDVLPVQAWAPRPKATFREVFFRHTTRDFIRGWTGGGIDPEWVDENTLRQLWQQEAPVGGSAALIQQTWLNLNR